MLYAAKCYWPGVSEAELQVVGARLADLGKVPNDELSYRGSLLFSQDDLVLCLFDGPSRSAVKRVSERAGIPCERVMDSVWLAPHPTEGDV